MGLGTLNASKTRIPSPRCEVDGSQMMEVVTSPCGLYVCGNPSLLDIYT